MISTHRQLYLEKFEHIQSEAGILCIINLFTYSVSDLIKLLFWATTIRFVADA